VRGLRADTDRCRNRVPGDAGFAGVGYRRIQGLAPSLNSGGGKRHIADGLGLIAYAFAPRA